MMQHTGFYIIQHRFLLVLLLSPLAAFSILSCCVIDDITLIVANQGKAWGQAARVWPVLLKGLDRKVGQGWVLHLRMHRPQLLLSPLPQHQTLKSLLTMLSLSAGLMLKLGT